MMREYVEDPDLIALNTQAAGRALLGVGLVAGAVAAVEYGPFVAGACLMNPNSCTELVVEAFNPNLTPLSPIGATGKVGETALKALGGESQAFFSTSRGARFVDQLVDGVAHESKVGYVSKTTEVARQVAKDTELIQSGQVEGAAWHFFPSPVTGKCGPSDPLCTMLEEAGIQVIREP